MFQDVKNSARLIWYSMLVFVLLAGAFLLGMMLYWHLMPWQMTQEREVYTSSRQFVEAKREMLLKLVVEHDAAETDIARYRAADAAKFKDVVKGLENQQESIRARINLEAKLIPSDQVPDVVRRLMR